MKYDCVSKEIQLFVLEFVDDTDFCTKGTDSGSKMQVIVDYDPSMHEDTGRKVQQQKKLIMFS